MIYFVHLYAGKIAVEIDDGILTSRARDVGILNHKEHILASSVGARTKEIIKEERKKEKRKKKKKRSREVQLGSKCRKT